MSDQALDWVLGGLVGLLCLLAVVACVMLGREYWMAQTHDCRSSHVEHRDAYVLPILVGKIIVPVWYDAEDVTVCDQWVPKH